MDSKVFNKVKIIYFSGTGGTACIANCIFELFLKRGIEVDIEALENNDYSKEINNIEDVDLIMVLFPVYAFDAPEPIYQWIKGLPKGDRRAVAIISVSGGGDIWPNSACSLGIIKKLQRKDYNIVYETMMVMPSNIMISIDQHLAIRLLKILPIKTEIIINELLEGKERRLKATISGRILTIMCKLEKPSAKILAKSFKVREKCNACGWCANICPKSNIDMQKNKPIFKWKCVACLRCIYGCPQKAIYTKLFSFLILKEGYSLELLQNKANDFKLEPLENIKFGFFFKGVKKYLIK